MIVRRCALVLCAACSSPAVAPPVTPAARHRTEIVVLGSGNPLPDPDRSGPSTAIVVDGAAYVFDCGPGVVRRAAAAAKRYGLDALEPEQLRYLFVTHLHTDHTLGYPDLMLTPWVTGRDFRLEVYGPPGIAAMTEHLGAAYAEDIAIRTDAEARADTSVPNVHEIEPGLVFHDDHVRVTAVSVHHGTWAHAFAYRIEGPDRSIVITGDYAPPADAIVTACNGCDVLVSEGYPTQIAKGERGPYLRAFHISMVELGALATKAGAKALVITHRRGGIADAVLLEELRRGYAGPVTFANDLDRL